MKINFLILFLALTAQAFSQLTFKVTSIPPNTPQGSNIHVAGSFQAWNPGDANYILTNNAGNYEITINPPAGALEFKFTRGNWASVEGNATGGEIANRTFNYNGTATTLELQILSWKDLGGAGGGTAADNVFILDDDFFIPQLNRNRRIWMYLPPDYDASEKFYPVLYMHDGQNVFDASTSFSGEWEVDETLNDLHADGNWGCIVVAIDNGGALRIDELAPWVNTNYNEGGEGDEYLQFIVETLKPYVDANYRTLAGRDYTGIFGSSLGGLISQYAMMKHQDVFSKVGDFSPAFWFNSPQIYDYTDAHPSELPTKTYLVAGYPEDNGSVVEDVNQMYDLLLNNGFGQDEVWKSFHEDGEHSEWYWAREFPAAYIWLFSGLNFTGASESAEKAIRIFPNPVDTTLFLEHIEGLKKPTWRIFSTDGKLVAKGKLTGNTIDVSRLPTGVYVLNVFSKKDKVFNGKMFVK